MALRCCQAQTVWKCASSNKIGYVAQVEDNLNPIALKKCINNSKVTVIFFMVGFCLLVELSSMGLACLVFTLNFADMHQDKKNTLPKF